MSYYTSSSTLMDPYSLGGGSRFDSTSSSYFNNYSSPAASAYNSSSSNSTSYGASVASNASSAIDRYYNYLDEITTTGPTSSSSSSSLSRSSYTSDLPRSRYSRYTSELLGTALGSAGSTSSSSGYSSRGASTLSSYTSSLYNDYSSRYSSRPSISRAPTYDKYGKELSNYDKWRLQNGDAMDAFNNNNSSSNSSYNSTSSYGNNNNDTSAAVVKARRRISRIEDDISTPITLSTSRELSVMPGSTSSIYDKEMSPLVSRFSSMSTSSSSNNKESRSSGRGTSMAPSAFSSSSTSAPYTSKSTYNPSSSSYSSVRSVSSFPLSVSSKLAGYDVRDVRGDGGCYYRCLSVYFTGAEDSYNKYRREVVAYIRENLENYSTMIRSEVGYASTNDYFSRKMRTDHQEFAETTEIIATCCLYNINVHVLARVPGKGTWEWLHFDPSIGSGKTSTASRDIYLYNQGSVHFMLCSKK